VKELTRGLWMQTITSKDGSKRRAFCLSCLKEGKEWIGGQLCQHMQEPAEEVAPTASLDSLENADQE
jgi:hypothetical protein